MKIKALWGFLLALTLTIAPLYSVEAALGFKGEQFEKVFYFSGASGKGALSGLSAANAKAIADTDIMAIPAGTVITKVWVIIDTAVTGSTAINIGDDDSSNGFVPTASLTLGTPGMYAWDAKAQGSYLRIQTAGATDAADIYVVPSAKYYSAAGKEIKLDNTTTNTGGAFRVVVQGYRLNL